MSDSSPQPQLTDETKNPASRPESVWPVRGHEPATRINYLFQASEEILKLDSALPGLAHNYGRVMTTIAEKTSAKLDFTLKRSACKTCDSILLPGVNAIYRLQRRKAPKGKSKKRRGFPTQIITCTLCGTCKKFPTDPKFQLKEKAVGVVVAAPSMKSKR